MNLSRQMLIAAHRVLYERVVRPAIFRESAMRGHERALNGMRRADQSPFLINLIRVAHRLAFEPQPVEVGGVVLPYPYILGAGWVKGDGFETEDAALASARSSRGNIIPGWRSIPLLLGPIEFGSFTRWPRVGNGGMVLWRDEATHSTQNRVGLKNPGAEAAAEFLAVRKVHLPDIYGINIAVTPGVDDPVRQTAEVLESVDAFLRRGVIPAWFTLNLSCPNTEDDPTGNQSEELAELLTGLLLTAIRDRGREVPLWVKIGPSLSEQQVGALMRAFAETGVRAVIATNTLPAPAPDGSGKHVGVAGGGLHRRAVETAQWAAREIGRNHFPIDVIGCGGVEDAATYHAFTSLGAAGVQYLSALVYHGPLAAASIQKEVLHG